MVVMRSLVVHLIQVCATKIHSLNFYQSLREWLLYPDEVLVQQPESFSSLQLLLQIAMHGCSLYFSLVIFFLPEYPVFEYPDHWPTLRNQKQLVDFFLSSLIAYRLHDPYAKVIL